MSKFGKYCRHPLSVALLPRRPRALLGPVWFVVFWWQLARAALTFAASAAPAVALVQADACKVWRVLPESCGSMLLLFYLSLCSSAKPLQSEKVRRRSLMPLRFISRLVKKFSQLSGIHVEL